MQTKSSVDGEIVHALFSLFDQRVPKDLPSEIFSDAADLLKRLVNRHRPNGYGTVTNDPVACGVDVLTC